MIRVLLFFISVTTIGVVGFAQELQPLQVSANSRYLERADGSPFFWLGDTAWELFHRLSLDESDRYLQNRAEKGFTVIQAVALAQLGGLEEPNANGDLPLIDRDPAQPNDAYFQHVDRVLNRAAELNLYVALLPTWGSWWKREGLFTPENATAYGRYLGERYRDQTNLIWVLGGDENAETEAEQAIIHAMAQGVQEGDGGAHLITYHPRGLGRSSDYFHDADWLDFNMYQSSHAARDHDTGLFAAADYRLTPVKPTLDGEPRYERIRVGFYLADVARNNRFDAYDVRQAAYWSLLAGAFGHTYGHNSVWQMYAPGRSPVIGAQTPWYEALDHPGAFQMGHVRRLFESRPFQLLVPDSTLVVDAPRTGGAKVRAARASDGSFAFIYTPRGEPVTVRMDGLASNRVTVTWFDPRYGTIETVHTSDGYGMQTYVPPTRGRGNDWILVLDDAEAGFGPVADRP